MPNLELQDYPAVSLFAGIEGKYVVVELFTLGNETKVVVRGDNSRAKHRQIMQDFREEAARYGHIANCLGGGKYLINRNEQTVLVWSQSFEFGAELNREHTLSLFREAFPGFTVTGLLDTEALLFDLDL